MSLHLAALTMTLIKVYNNFWQEQWWHLSYLVYCFKTNLVLKQAICKFQSIIIWAQLGNICFYFTKYLVICRECFGDDSETSNSIYNLLEQPLGVRGWASNEHQSWQLQFVFSYFYKGVLYIMLSCFTIFVDQFAVKPNYKLKLASRYCLLWWIKNFPYPVLRHQKKCGGEEGGEQARIK